MGDLDSPKTSLVFSTQPSEGLPHFVPKVAQECAVEVKYHIELLVRPLSRLDVEDCETRLENIVTLNYCDSTETPWARLLNLDLPGNFPLFPDLQVWSSARNMVKRKFGRVQHLMRQGILTQPANMSGEGSTSAVNQRGQRSTLKCKTRSGAPDLSPGCRCEQYDVGWKTLAFSASLGLSLLVLPEKYDGSITTAEEASRRP